MKKIMPSLSLGLVVLCMLLSRSHAQAPSYDQPWRPQYHFTPPQNFMNDRQRDGLLQGRISPVLPVQPRRQRVGTHELGTRRQQRPGALAEPAGRAARSPRPVHGLFRKRGGGLEQQQRPVPESRPARPFLPGGHLHRCLQRPAETAHRVQQRPRPDLDELLGQSRRRPRCSRLPRSQCVLVCAATQVGDGRGAGRRKNAGDPRLARSQALDQAFDLRSRRRYGGTVGVSRPDSNFRSKAAPKRSGC